MMATVASWLLLLGGLVDAQPNKPHPCGGPGEPACTVIQNLHELDCKTSQFAFEYGTAKVKTSPQSLHDALNLWNCTEWLTPEQKLANAAVLASAASSDARTTLTAAAVAAVYVSPHGSDSAAGTEASPLRTLGAAVGLATKSHAEAVVLRGGKYYLNSTLELTLAHSGLRIAAFEGEYCRHHCQQPPGVDAQLFPGDFADRRRCTLEKVDGPLLRCSSSEGQRDGLSGSRPGVSARRLT